MMIDEDVDEPMDMSPEDMAGGGSFYGGLTDDIFDGSGLSERLRIFALFQMSFLANDNTGMVHH